eukprot:13709728-Alexandrium_andersonii.AAC.1
MALPSSTRTVNELRRQFNADVALEPLGKGVAIEIARVCESSLRARHCNTWEPPDANGLEIALLGGERPCLNQIVR